MNSPPCSSEAFFEAKYRQQADPWNFSKSEYEQSRYAATISALNGRYFERAFEPGCSIGVLTEKLAAFCKRVEAMDISAAAVSQAQERCRHLSNVSVRHGSLPQDRPAGTFDLIVFSEVGYYFDKPSLEALAVEIISQLIPAGILLAVHWLGSSVDHCLSGDEVHDTLSNLPLKLLIRERHPKFRLDLWSKE